MQKHIKEALLFAATLDVRYYLNSVAVLPIGTVATDGRRLYLNPNFCGAGEIYCRDSIALLDGIDGARVIVAKYPDMALVIPRETTPVDFDVRRFAADLRGAKAVHAALRKQFAADRAAGKADKNAYDAAKLDARCGSVFWYSGQWVTQIGKVDEKQQLTKDGWVNTTSGVNAAYLHDAIKVGFVDFEQADNGTLKSTRADGAIVVIMPIRVTK